MFVDVSFGERRWWFLLFCPFHFALHTLHFAVQVTQAGHVRATRSSVQVTSSQVQKSAFCAKPMLTGRYFFQGHAKYCFCVGRISITEEKCIWLASPGRQSGVPMSAFAW